MLYVFADCVLDTQLRELRRADVPVKLEYQAFQALAYLIQHRDRAVSRQDLFDHLYPEQDVFDAALERCIAVVRRAIGDSGHAQQYIKTLHRYGYRFVATLEECDVDLSNDEVRAEPHLESVLAEESLGPAEAGATIDASSATETAHPSVPRPVSRSAIAGERKSATVLCGTLAHTTRCPFHKFAASPAAARLYGLGGYKVRSNRWGRELNQARPWRC